MNGRKVLSIMLLCAMMLSLFLIYQEEAEAATVDFIIIVDTPGTGSAEIPDQSVIVGQQITGYAASFNNSLGYQGDVSVDWTVTPSGSEDATTSPPSGTNSTFNAGTVGGTVIWMADDGSGHTDAVVFAISTATVDYIEITDSPGGTPVDNGTVSPDDQFWGYCSAYNFSYGYVGLGNADWTAEGGNAFLLNITPAEYNGIDVGTVYGWVWFNASYLGKSYSINYYLSPPPPTVDYILILDAPDSGASEIPDQTIEAGIQIAGYAASFNNTAGYLWEEWVDWTVLNVGGATASTNPPHNSTSVFYSGLTNGTATWKADDGSGHIDTVVFTIINGTDYNIDYIEITDVPDGVPLPGGSVLVVFQEWGYCSANNISAGYLGFVNADWIAEGGSSSLLASTPATTNGIYVGTIPGTVWFNASYSGKSDSVQYTVNPATTDFVVIVDLPNTGSNVISDQTVNLNYTITGYAAAFNNSLGYIGDVSVDWTVIPNGGENAYTTPPTGTSSTFNSGTVTGSVTWLIDDGSGNSDTVLFTILSGGNASVDYIKIVDTGDIGTTEILDQTVNLWFQITGYAAAFNNSVGYLYDISVLWTVSNSNGSNASTSPSSGSSSTFYAKDATGVATWEADDGSGHVDTVEFTIVSGNIDYILITSSADGPEIPDQTMNIGYYIMGWASAYNNTSGYMGLISVAWSVTNFDGATSYTTPPSGGSSTFAAGTTGGNATWTADDGSGHTDTVNFEITDYTVDYILIVDTEGTGSTEIPDQTVDPWFGIWGYAAAFNSTAGYFGEVTVSWSIMNSDGANASISTTNGTQCHFDAGDSFGNATWTADDGAGNTDTVVFTIDPSAVDYIWITYPSNGIEIGDQDINVGFNIGGEARAYNNTSGYLGLLSVSWSVTNSNGSTAYTNNNSGSAAIFYSGSTAGNSLWTADDGYGHTDTVWFTITDYIVDYILIRSSPGGGGSEIPDQTVFTGFDETGFAAAYNDTYGFIDDISVTWTVSNANGSNASTSPSSGESSSFNAGNQEGTATWTADDGSGHVDTVVFTIITGPSYPVDFIRIVHAPNNGSSEIPDQVVPPGYTITGYAAGYNYTYGYVGDVPVDWSVINSGGASASTNPATGTSSEFDAGTTTGSATWTADYGSGIIDTVEFTIDIGPDYILIVDTPGTGFTEIPDQTVMVGYQITGYAASFNSTSGYIGDVSVTWTVQNSGGASASTSPSSGVSSDFSSGSSSGTAIWTADDGMGNTDTVVFTINPPTTDYIIIFDGPGSGNSSEIMDQTINIGTDITGYALAFNNTIGYLYEVSVTWTVANFDGASASTAPSSGTSSMFSSGSTNGNATWTADDGAGHTDTVLFTIVGQVYYIDYISIRDAPGGGGNIIGDRTYSVWDTDTFYAVAFNFTIGYVMDVEVSWESDNETIGTVTTPGESTLFTAEWIVADATCIVTATYNSLTNTTGNLEVLSPRTDYVQIRDAPDGGGAIITSISYNKGDEDYFYGAAYNNTVDFVDNVPSTSTWDSSDPSIVVVTSPGSSTHVMCNDTNSGTITVTLTVGIIPINTTIVVVLEWDVDYILIRDAPAGGGSNLCDPLNYPSYPVGHVTTFYGAMYNDTAGYIGDVGSNSIWSSDDTSIVDVTSPGVFSTITCSDTNYGTVVIGLEEWMGHNATTQVTVIEPTLDFITIMDASGGSGYAIGDMSYEIGDEDTYYSAAFNTTAGFLYDVSVSWSSSDITVGTVDPATGSSTVFTAEDMGTCTVTADYGGGISDATGTLTVTLPSNITVDDSGGAHFTTIQEAIDYAKDGDTVFVYSGTYFEHLTINKSITLMGQDKYTTIIDGEGTGKIIYVSGGNVSISGFTIQDCEYSIYCDESDATTITYNIIRDYDYGIYNYKTTDGWITYNKITSGKDGIITYEAYNDAIRYNTISYNTEYGAKDYDSQLKNCFNWNYFHHNHIAYYYDPDIPLSVLEFDGNILEDNYIAIMVENASTISITNNTLVRNDYGIYLINASPDIAFNTISNADYGIYTEHSSSLISNNIIKDIAEYGIHVQFGDSLNITNNSVVDTTMIFFDSGIEELWLIDSTVILVNTPIEESHLDATSSIDVRWFLQIKVVDDEGIPVKDAAVLVYDGFDNLVSTQVTDLEGLTESLLVIDTFEDYTSTLTYNPYRVNVIKGSLETTSTITITEDAVLTITLQDSGSVIKPATSAFPWALVFLIGFIAALGVSGLAVEIFKYGLISLFLPLYSRIRKEKVLDQPTRYKIYGYIIGNPGAFFGLIKEELELGSGQLGYHLKQLKEAHLIYSREDGVKKRFYPADIPKPKSGLPHFSDIQEKILGIIKNNSGIGQKKIASSVGISRQVAGYHLKIMERKGIINKEVEGRESRYYPSGNYTV